MSPTQTSQHDLCIKWNSYLGNLGAAFPKLLADQRFLDVTLSCEGQQIRCHKVVLAACSPYLETLLNENPCKHPIIVLPHNIKMWELQALIDFMYKGEVNVSHAGLADFVKCAELLQVRGLSGSEEDLHFNSTTNSSMQLATTTPARRISLDFTPPPGDAEGTTERETRHPPVAGPSTSKNTSLNPKNNGHLKPQQLLPSLRSGNPKLELIEENCDDEEPLPGENGGAEHLVEILCDLPNDTHYNSVTQTSIIEHVEELDVNGQTNNSAYSDLDFDYIEQDSCRDSLNDIVSELTMNEQDSKGDYGRMNVRRRPISEEKSDSDGGTSGYSSLQILDVRSLAANSCTTPLKAALRPSSTNSDDNNADVRVMLSTSLTRAIKKNVMNNRSYAIFRKTVRRHSTFGTRKRRSVNNRRPDRCLSPSLVVLPPPKPSKPREYDAKAMYTALMEVKSGSGISDTAMRHKIPRTTLCNWLKRLNIKSASTSRQKDADSRKK